MGTSNIQRCAALTGGNYCGFPLSLERRKPCSPQHSRRTLTGNSAPAVLVALLGSGIGCATGIVTLDRTSGLLGDYIAMSDQPCEPISRPEAAPD